MKLMNIPTNEEFFSVECLSHLYGGYHMRVVCMSRHYQDADAGDDDTGIPQWVLCFCICYTLKVQLTNSMANSGNYSGTQYQVNSELNIDEKQF
jgi:hypothetical protein